MNQILLAVCVKRSGNLMYRLTKNRKPSVFRINLTADIDDFPKPYQLLGTCNRDAACFLQGSTNLHTLLRSSLVQSL
jgi:hypothetical protein